MPEASDSSVMFNLNELMQLEHERVAAERAAVREAELEQVRARERAAVEARAEREREAEADRARERAEQERQATLEAEHEAAMLRTRLELEMHERAAQREAMRLHEQALRRVDAEARGAGASRALGVLFVLTLALGAGGYFGLLAPALEQSRAAERDVRAHLDAQAADLARMRTALQDADAETRAAHAALGRLATRESEREGVAKPAVEPSRTAKADRGRHGGRRSGPTAARAEPRKAPEKDPLGDLNLGSSDPIEGVID